MTEGVHPQASLDPADWSELRALGHRMLDDLFNELEGIRQEPVWQPMPDSVRGAWDQPMQHAGLPMASLRRVSTAARAVCGRQQTSAILRLGACAGTAVGVLAEMLAAGLNANCGGRDHAPIACEQQVIRWAAKMLGLPPGSSGLVVTGASMVNLVAVIIARRAALGSAIHDHGSGRPQLTVYASEAVHLCVGRALEITGLGSGSLRLIPCDASGAMDIAALRVAIAADRDRNLLPFLVVSTAGTVDIGAIDDLTQMAQVCEEEQLWFHVDAAFGAIAMLSPVLRPLLTGIERADSVAFDFHKWAQVPYDAGCIVVRDPVAHQAAFAHEAAYLRRETRGLAAGQALAGRSWSGAVAGLSCAQGLDDDQGLWHGPARGSCRALLCTGAPACVSDRRRTAARADGAGSVEHRLLPLSPG